MEDSKPINVEKLIELTRCNDILFDFLRKNNALFSCEGVCTRCGHGHIHLNCEKSSSDGLIWRCSTRHCTYKISFRKHSFFSGSKLQIARITKIIYFWAHRYPREIVIHETGISNGSVVAFYNFLLEACCIVLQEQSEPIGGPGTFVEIDESKFRTREYHLGKRAKGVWFFGGIERDSNPPKCFFIPIEDCSAATIIPVIKQWIKPGTTVLSDCWKQYYLLEAQGYIHSTANHSIEFVSKSGTHRNNTASHWNALKRSLPRYRTTKAVCFSHFVDYCIRRKFLDNAKDKFLETLRLISLVYHPNRSLDIQPESVLQPQAQHEPQPQPQPLIVEKLLSQSDNNNVGNITTEENSSDFSLM